MTNEELVQKFYDITMSNGRNVSTRHNKSYWVNNGYEEIYDLILERTSFLDNSIIKHIKERVSALENGLTEHPKCVSCGKPVMILNRSIFSKYCSKECSYKDPDITIKRKESAKKVDKQIASEKRKKTMIKKYGVPYNSQRKDVKDVLSQSKLKYSKPDSLTKLESYEWMFENYVNLRRTLVDIAKELDVYYGTVGDYCLKHGFEIRQQTNYSIQEKEIGEFVNSLGFDYSADRSLLDGHEIDILVNGVPFGIEVDGVYWHSYNRFESDDEKRKHLNKTLVALNKGIQLIHIFDYEWIYKKSIVKSIIRNKLNLSKKIYARKCEIKEVDSVSSTKFLDENHIQGAIGGKIRIGLFYNDELVMLMTFGKPRFNKKYSWELIRMSTAIDRTVIGGASKLFKFFINNYDIGNGIICYSDRRFGEGDVYKSLGFNYEKSTTPSYKWTNGDIVWNRTKFQKNKLEGLLKNYNDNLSEAENMFNNKFRRLWDCGSNVYVYK